MIELRQGLFIRAPITWPKGPSTLNVSHPPPSPALSLLTRESYPVGTPGQSCPPPIPASFSSALPTSLGHSFHHGLLDFAQRGTW
jgi:hypothetical protein